MRLSSFTILSEPLPNGNIVLLNGFSGAMDIVPPLLAAFFDHILKNNPHGQASIEKDLLPTETFSDLLERGHLTRLSHKREKFVVSEIAKGLHEKEKTRPYFMIVPNMDCNYRCVYCFERPLQKKFKSKTSDISYYNKNVVMQPDAIHQIYSCIEKIQAESGGNTGGMIILYGGEPLDSKHKDLIFKIVRDGSARGYWFSAVTNGHDLNAFLPILGNNLLKNIQVTIDGPKHTHDTRRIYRGKESSFDKIIANIHKALKIRGTEVDIRVHVDPDNIDYFKELLMFFEREGWTDNESVTIYGSTLYNKNEKSQISVKMAVADIAMRLDHLAGPYKNVFTSAPAVHIARAIAPAFESGNRFALQGAHCSANFGNFIFAPDGHVYACWESIGKASGRIGNYLIEQGFVFNRAAVEKWFNRNVAVVDGCLECEFALACGGGCAQYAEYNNGSPYKSHCDDFQRNFRVVLADEVARRL